ncbi:hypothetical protein AAVH_04155 [Aphelenchoides avenae]|nr:hypothetical protein AAVH_04155 [Aphelenchus avenae]
MSSESDELLKPLKPRVFGNVKVPFNVAIGLLFGILGLAIVPGFYILGYYQSVVMETPTEWSALASAAYVFKFFSSTVAMALAVILYADVSFPLVMFSFGEIFSRIELK